MLTAETDTGQEAIQRRSTVTLRPPQGLGQHLVGDAVERVVKVLIATTAHRKLVERGESPTPSYQMNEAVYLSRSVV